jgi:hypothetical protein
MEKTIGIYIIHAHGEDKAKNIALKVLKNLRFLACENGTFSRHEIGDFVAYANRRFATTLRRFEDDKIFQSGSMQEHVMPKSRLRELANAVASVVASDFYLFSGIIPVGRKSDVECLPESWMALARVGY